MDHDDQTGLTLSLACGGGDPTTPPGPSRRRDVKAEPSLTLSLSDDTHSPATPMSEATTGGGKAGAARVSSPPHSTVSSFSAATVKREEGEAGACSRTSDEDEDGNPRKKLRLTKEQSALLEDRFKEHSSLNPKQKQALAKQLNLRPRQVEVWFQNRRARTKLKQTEVDCEFLKRCCETLTEENRRLQKEVSELRAMKLAAPLYMQLPAATLTMCPSCERVAGAGENKAAAAGPFVVAAAAQKPHFFNPFTHSATC